MTLNLKSVSLPAAGSARMSTPNVLYTMLVVVLGLAIVWAGSMYYAVSSGRNVLETVTGRGVPSIVSTLEIRARLMEMDASATTEFLSDGAASRAREQYDEARGKVSALLTEASRRSGASPEEKASLTTIYTKLQEYNGNIETARANARQGFPIGAAWMRTSVNLMRGSILPAVDQLDIINQKYLDAQVSSHQSGVTTNLAFGLVSGLALLGALVYTQIFLTRRTRRTTNPALVGASIAVVAVLVWFGLAVQSSDTNLRASTEQSFASMKVLWQARATAYDAKADQNLYLIQRGNGKKYEDSFDAKAKALADQSKLVSAQGNLPQAVVDFLGVHANIKTLEKGGQRGKAVELAVTSGVGTSNAAFQTMDSKLGAALKVYTDSYSSAATSAMNALSMLDLFGFIAALAAVLLTWFGLRPRINEYRV